ncbi:hypothetical protein E9840_11375 [Tissierella creatinini]|nr:hypothetical protein E9840_11375 [Tissierella creatinini]TJX60873.1 hypothetical protein E8P77_19400 [Soehngenia saccharolytica]
MNLYISTFGNFDISDENHSLLKDASRQYRLYKLLQYFIAFRNKRLLPETIIDNLFRDSESLDPKNVLRTQIFRLRQELKGIIPESENESDYMYISFINGYYCLETGRKIIIDAAQFENLIAEGDQVINTDIERAKDLYGKAIKLYKGTYLSENPYEVWIVPIRNYFSRLYIKTLAKLMEILKDEDRNEEIIELCEEALFIEPYEEIIHIFLIEAMLNLGQITNAKNHYDYAASIIEKEVGIKSSHGLKNIYRKILNYLNEKTNVDITNIGPKLDGKDEGGAFYCDLDCFKFLYNIQRRKSSRQNENDLIAIITLKEDNIIYDENDTKKWIKHMTDLLKDSLRSSDAFTFWNDSQILLLLHEVRGDGNEIIENRIRKRLDGLYDFKITFKSLSVENVLSEGV